MNRSGREGGLGHADLDGRKEHPVLRLGKMINWKPLEPTVSTFGERFNHIKS
jgi:hypothetical protein